MSKPIKDYLKLTGMGIPGLQGKWKFIVRDGFKPGKFPKSTGNEKRGKGAK